MRNILIVIILVAAIGYSHSRSVAEQVQKDETPNNIRIQKGDTLSELAAKHKISRKDLRKLNPRIKNPDIIIAGRNLVLRRNRRK